MRINRLSALAVKLMVRKRERGKVADGGNLYLQDGSAWVFRYERDGRERFMGPGSALDVTLAEARDRARDARRLLARGVDPLAERRTSRRQDADLRRIRRRTHRGEPDRLVGDPMCSNGGPR